MTPDWLRENLASPTQSGAGIYAWLFSVAQQLHAYMPSGVVEAALTATTLGADTATWSARSAAGLALARLLADAQVVSRKPEPVLPHDPR